LPDKIGAVSKEEREARLAREVGRNRDEYGNLSDEELIAMLNPTPDHISAPMEMQRRLIAATRDLRTSLDAFAASSRRLGLALMSSPSSSRRRP
jgi:hypothetical protein